VPQGSIGRRVARAAASGGSKAYRGRRPVGWYASLAMISIVGIGLISYSRYEANHPSTTTTTTTTTIGPGLSSEWYAALAFDICGKVTTLPPSTNTTASGLRSVGNGLILIEPGSVPNSQDFVGNMATLQNFIIHYQPTMTLTNTEVQLPPTTTTVGKGKKTTTKTTKQPLYRNGDKCGSKPAELQVKTWTTFAAPQGQLVTDNPIGLKWNNGQMIVVGFVPKGTNIPTPAKSTVSELEIEYEQSLANNGLVPTTTLPTTIPSTTVIGPTTTTVKGAPTTTVKGAPTTTVKPGSTTTTVKPSSTTSSSATTTTVPATSTTS